MTPEPVNILLVDDQPMNLLALEAVLENPAYGLVRASSGEEALKRLLQAEFAVILLDVMMPGMSGFETAELIRGREKTRHTPIIFLTAIGKDETHVSLGYEVGAVDYLFKPVEPAILRAKVAAFVDLFRKTGQVRAQSERLREMERREHEAKLAEAQRRLEAERLRQEILLARDIQQRLFPKTPPACPGVDLWGASFPAEATGGDYFDFFPAAGGLTAAAIGDVCGHGYGPALLMSATRAYLRALSLEHRGVQEVLQLANRALAADIGEDQFVTLLLGQINARERTLVYASAGHPPGYVLSPSGDTRSVLESTAFPLGVVAECEFPAGVMTQLEAGDVVFFHTDGLTEAAGPRGERYGTERALMAIREHRHLSSREIVGALYSSVTAFAHGRPQLDDITAIIVKIR